MTDCALGAKSFWPLVLAKIVYAFYIFKWLQKKKKSKEKEYFVTCENHMSFKFQCTKQSLTGAQLHSLVCLPAVAAFLCHNGPVEELRQRPLTDKAESIYSGLLQKMSADPLGHNVVDHSQCEVDFTGWVEVRGGMGGGR